MVKNSGIYNVFLMGNQKAVAFQGLFFNLSLPKIQRSYSFLVRRIARVTLGSTREVRLKVDNLMLIRESDIY